ncbi:alpha/beta hydrolase [Cyanobium sp. Copco_Reservoir_LC18]|uniref:alpha/beta fold hydrolase n=1 Tax=Cyanobium sp. Copco_Reservoir_LC18 TaxID=1328305 RepID=UPI0013586C55|nr:alpha/beta fold hydrolase [Cyanobium sp. Copco_Reservoir_LC18]KAF0653137.1 alpha/beta hydrolase [Cyanobium sp. Copco_Reservoir_LC18]
MPVPAPADAGTIFPADWLGTWSWQGQSISYVTRPSALPEATGALPALLIHGFGACKEHWRHNLPALAGRRPVYAIDLVGFGASSKPPSRLEDEPEDGLALRYGIDLWADQVAAFVREVVGTPVQLVGNSIGGVVALAAAARLGDDARQVILIDCAQRSLDDRRLSEQPPLRRIGRPLLKRLVRQRWLTGRLFRWVANPAVIRRVLGAAYPSGAGIDDQLVQLLLTPARSPGAEESFRGFINLFRDRLAPDLLAELPGPVRLLWGEADPWEPVAEARRWAEAFASIHDLRILGGLGHCPHDENPSRVNPVLEEWLALADQA